MNKEKVNPNKSAYTPEDHNKIKRITDWLSADDSRTAAELSRLSAIKEGTRSSILNGSYISSPTKFLDRMLNAIERQEERDRSGKADIPFTQTSVALAMRGVCGRAHNDKDFGIFLGRVGTGKTTALREYTKNTPTAVLIEAFEGIDHSTFMDELIKATGVTVSKGTAASKMAQLINALRATDKVILVDEANWLPKRSFGALRRISDVAEVGVVLVGTPDLLPMVQDPNGRFGQISSRIGFWPAVVQTITEKDCQDLVNSYFSDPVDEATLKAFWSCCEGSARTLRNLLRNTYRSASKNKTEVSASLVKRINTQTMAGRGGFVAGRV